MNFNKKALVINHKKQDITKRLVRLKLHKAILSEIIVTISYVLHITHFTYILYI